MKKLIAFALSLSPSLAFAQTLGTINDVAQKATNIGDLIIKLAISFAVLYIIISIVRYLIAGGEEDKKKGGMAILYGVIGLVAILSIWGLVFLLTNSFQFANNRQPDLNQIKLPTPPQVP